MSADGADVGLRFVPYALAKCRRIKIKYFAIRSGLAVVKNLGDGFFDFVARLGSGGSVAEAADDFKQLFSIPWDHQRRIIDRCKGDMDKALFFVRKTWENNWGRDALLNWLDTDLYERDGKAVTNFQSTLPAVQSDLAQQMTKDPYQFDFLTFSV